MDCKFLLNKMNLIFLIQPFLNFQAKEKRLWEKTLAHLSLDFHVSTENPNYILHLTNSMKVAFEVIQQFLSYNYRIMKSLTSYFHTCIAQYLAEND